MWYILQGENYDSLDMATVLSRMPGGLNDVKAQLVLEINSEHAITDKRFEFFAEDKEKIEKYTKILYNEARLSAVWK